MYARSPSGGLRGLKVGFGLRSGLAPRDQSTVRYFIAVPAKDWLCFEARPPGRSPQWQDASELILGAKFDRS